MREQRCKDVGAFIERIKYIYRECKYCTNCQNFYYDEKCRCGVREGCIKCKKCSKVDYPYNFAQDNYHEHKLHRQICLNCEKEENYNDIVKSIMGLDVSKIYYKIDPLFLLDNNINPEDYRTGWTYKQQRGYLIFYNWKKEEINKIKLKNILTLLK